MKKILYFLLFTFYFLLAFFTGCDKDERVFGSKSKLLGTTSTASTSVSTPTGLIAAAGDGQVTLSWNAVSDASYYRIYRSLSAYDTYSYISYTYSTNYTDTGLTNGTAYYYKVSAVSSSGAESSLSDYVSATPTASGDAYEPDDSFSQYSNLANGQSRSIQPAGDYDYIQFYANSGYTYTFYSTGNIDNYATLYTETQSHVTSDDESGDGSNFRIVWTCNSSGYYYLVIKGYYSSTTGAYTLYYSY
ncbi:MAG: hypothetical protein AB1349_05905 [Elusimicrobiota bacterium]